ncbi:MAG: MBL fold metallo-hydrolase [Planctomycetes bacterium]|nr:MBL fold metallo-hydrolase [Planctomycetota bacterium]
MSLKPVLKEPFEEVLPDLFRYHGDCCAVYVLRWDDRALLIDLGSGAVLDDLPRLGIRRVDSVTLTHAHRDQCQGADRLDRAGVPLHLPRAAEDFVRPEKRRDFRLATPLLRAYPGDGFEPPRPMSHALFDVQPGQTVRFGPFLLDVHPAPGHTGHQVAYLWWKDPHHVLFCGDEIHSPGKIHEPYHLETDHYTGTGARRAADSLRSLRMLCPNVLCPSHGPVFRGDTWPVFLETEDALERLGRLKDSIFPGCGPDQRLIRPWGTQLTRLTDHLLLWANSYFLLADEGGALMVDCGNAFTETLWDDFARESGGRRVEVVLITHIHCDHLEEVGNLRRVFPEAQVWVHENLAAVVEKPSAFRRPWLARERLRVDRALREADTVRWREYELTAHFYPGQTDLHACYEAHVDGHHVLFSGDNFYPAQQWGGMGGLCGLNGGNPRRGWRKSIQLVMDIRPEWMLCAHTHPFLYRRDHFEKALAWTEETARQMEALAPDGNLERHHDPHWTGLFPYVQQARAGEDFHVMAALHNTCAQTRNASVALVVPADWLCTPEICTAEVPPDGEARLAFTVRAPRSASGRHLLALDVLYDGVYLGEKAECYVDVDPFWPPFLIPAG